MAISLRLLCLCLLLLVGLMLGEALEVFDESRADCTAQVLKATASCQASNSEQSSMAEDVCGTTTYTTTMTTVTHMKELATQQGSIITHSVELLAKAKAQAAAIAKEAGVERKVLLSKLGEQKTSKEGVSKLKGEETHTESDMESLKSQADRATEEAVEIARSTDDPKTVEAAKKKACDLRSRYLDLELKLATLHRSVHTAKKALLKVNQVVETEISKAKATGEREATALKIIAKDKQGLAEGQKKQAEIEVEANAKASRAAQAAEHTLKIREEKARKDVSDAKSNVAQVNRIAEKAKAEEDAQKSKKPEDEEIDMNKLELEAKQQAGAMLDDVQHADSDDQTTSSKQSEQSDQSKQEAQTAVIKAIASQKAPKEAPAQAEQVDGAAEAHDESTTMKHRAHQAVAARDAALKHKAGMKMEHRAHQAVARARGEPLHPKFDPSHPEFGGKQQKQGVVQQANQTKGDDFDHMTAGGQTSSHHAGEDFVVHRQHKKNNGFAITHEITKRGSIINVDHKPRKKAKKVKKAKKAKKVVQVKTTGAPSDIHDRYAKKVREIEHQRLEAIDLHKEANKNLNKLEASHASAPKIEEAKMDVAAAAKTMKNLLQAQNSAVARVVEHIQNKEPEYTAGQQKTPTDGATPGDSNNFAELDKKPNKPN